MRRSRSVDHGSRCSTIGGIAAGGTPAGSTAPAEAQAHRSASSGTAGLLLAALALLGCAGIPTTPTSTRDDPPIHAPPPDALWFGGDVHFGASGEVGLGDIPASLAGAVGVVNLEGPIAAGPGGAEDRGGEVVLSNPADSGDRLRALGIRAVSIANNHAGDAGAEGEARTRDALTRAGLAAADPEGATFVAGETAVRLVALDIEQHDALYHLDTGDVGPTGVFTVISLHVTGPPSYLPGPTLERAVEEAVGIGADVVVVHGTHVLGKVERRRRSVIAWGLGNLLFNCPCTGESEGMILRVELTRGLPARVLPVRAGLGGASAALHPDSLGIFKLLDGLGGTSLSTSRVWGSF